MFCTFSSWPQCRKPAPSLHDLGCASKRICVSQLTRVFSESSVQTIFCVEKGHSNALKPSPTFAKSSYKCWYLRGHKAERIYWKAGSLQRLNYPSLAKFSAPNNLLHPMESQLTDSHAGIQRSRGVWSVARLASSENDFRKFHEIFGDFDLPPRSFTLGYQIKVVVIDTFKSVNV